MDEESCAKIKELRYGEVDNEGKLTQKGPISYDDFVKLYEDESTNINYKTPIYHETEIKEWTQIWKLPEFFKQIDIDEYNKLQNFKNGKRKQNNNERKEEKEEEDIDNKNAEIDNENNSGNQPLAKPMSIKEANEKYEKEKPEIDKDRIKDAPEEDTPTFCCILM